MQSLLTKEMKATSPNEVLSNKDSQKKAQKAALIEALKKTNGNVTNAAKLMGIKREHAQKLKKDYGIKNNNIE